MPVIAPAHAIIVIVGMAANGLLAMGSYAIARHGLGLPPGLPRWLGACALFWTASTIGLEGLGSIGAIGAYPILIWAAAVAGAGAWLGWTRRPRPAGKPSDAADAPLGDDALLGGEDPGKADHADDRALSGEALFSLSLTLAAALIFAIPSLFMAVKVVSDGPIYHLYFAARWWKAGRLFLVAAPFGENAATYFPANGDLWFTWLMACWGGDGLAKIGQAPFLLLAGAAAYDCARSLGVGRSAAAIAACWFVTSSPLLLFSFEPNVDTIFVAGYLLAAGFFLRFARGRGGVSALFLGGLAAGEALGTKAIGVVFVPPLIALSIAAAVSRPAPGRIKLRDAAIAALAPLITCGYWYFRNARLTGSPLYPLDVRVLGRTVWAGWYGPEAMRTSPYYLPRGQWTALGDILLAVLDPRLAPFWLLAAAGAWAVANARMRGTRRWIGLFGLLAVANVALYWIVIPYRTQQRFMLHALGLAVVPLSAMLDRSRWLRLAATMLLTLHILTPQSWPFPAREDAIPWDLDRRIPNSMGSLMTLSPRIEPGYQPGRSTGSTWKWTTVGLIAASFAMVVCWQQVRLRRDRPSPVFWRTLAAAAAAIFVGLGCLDVGARAFDPLFRFYPPFPDFYAGWRAFDTYCGARGARVAYAGTNIPFYLLGEGLRNEVRYVNVDAHRDWLLHDYHRLAASRGQGLWPNSRPGWDRIHPDFPAWLGNLDAEGIQLLVVTRVNPAEGAHNVADPQGFPIERAWADAHPERFELVYGQRERDPWFRLYRLRRPRVP